MGSTFIQNEIDHLAHRFAIYLTHYRKPMEYSDEAIQAASNGLEHLKNQVRSLMRKG
jgi:cysteinyl-tRNA synthetase